MTTATTYNEYKHVRTYNDYVLDGCMMRGRHLLRGAILFSFLYLKDGSHESGGKVEYHVQSHNGKHLARKRITFTR